MSRRRGRVPALSLDDLDTWLAGQPDIAQRNWTVTSIEVISSVSPSTAKLALVAWWTSRSPLVGSPPG